MRSRSALFAHCSFLALLLVALVVELGIALSAGAIPASAGPTVCLPGPALALRALVAVQQSRLIAADGALGDEFGWSVSISGDTAVVGVPFGDSGDPGGQGSAYVFVRSGGAWSQQAKLTAADGAPSDEFGSSVAISGDTVVVGAWGDDIGTNEWQGSAYVFVRSGAAWSEEAHLVAADGGVNHEFGSSVAVLGDTIVVGAPGRAAYVYTRTAGVWSQQARLDPTDDSYGSAFGVSVAISGDTVVVGAQRDDIDEIDEQGSAYVYVRDGDAWTQQQKLVAANGAAQDFFGDSVTISGETIVVGVPGDDLGSNLDGGSAYAYVRSGTVWSQQARLVASDGADSHQFGDSVTISGDTMVVSAPAYDSDDRTWDVYVYTRSDSVWRQKVRPSAAGGTAKDYFGCSVAISGDTILVGAPWDDVGIKKNQGSVFVFQLADVTRPGRPAPQSPKGLISSRTPTFRWTKAARATTYEVRIYRGSKLIKKKAGITANSWKCTLRLPRAVWLTWKVQARNAAGAGPWSAKPRFKVR